MEHCWNSTDGRNRSTPRKSCTIPTLSFTNITWTDLGSNPGLGSKQPLFYSSAALVGSRHTTVGRTPLDEWLVRRRQDANIHAPGGIRIRNSRKWSTADPRIRPLGHWDRTKRYLKFEDFVDYIWNSTSLPHRKQCSSDQTESSNAVWGDSLVCCGNHKGIRKYTVWTE
jgi:hypothetical protein